MEFRKGFLKALVLPTSAWFSSNFRMVLLGKERGAVMLYQAIWRMTGNISPQIAVSAITVVMSHRCWDLSLQAAVHTSKQIGLFYSWKLFYAYSVPPPPVAVKMRNQTPPTPSCSGCKVLLVHLWVLHSPQQVPYLHFPGYLPPHHHIQFHFAKYIQQILNTLFNKS